MADIGINVGEVLDGLKAIRSVLDRLESRLMPAEAQIRDPYKRRREILDKIYWAGNSIPREELFSVLREHGTQYQWIGQQVKRGYLSVLPVPGGGVRYSVTPRAVRELALGQEAPEAPEEAAAFAKLSEASFAEEWDSPEDSIYDRL